jgi:hypothetical protein
VLSLRIPKAEQVKPHQIKIAAVTDSTARPIAETTEQKG